MCLTFKSTYGGEVELPVEKKIAEHDIICFKYLRRNNTSIHYDYHYVEGRLNPHVPITLLYSNWDNSVTIEQGYHSYKSTKPNYADSLCIIPKGTVYYEGFDNGDGGTSVYVSETIVFIGKSTYWDLFKLRVKLFLGKQLWSKNS